MACRIGKSQPFALLLVFVFLNDVIKFEGNALLCDGGLGGGSLFSSDGNLWLYSFLFPLSQLSMSLPQL